MVCTYKFSSKIVITEAAASFILQTHPIVVIKENGAQVACIAGIRSYQMAVSRLPPSYKIPVLIVSKFDSTEIKNISAADIYLTNLLYGLESQAWDLSFSQIWLALNSELRSNLTPGVNSKTQLANALGINRRNLSPKQPHLCSELRTTLLTKEARNEQ